MRFCPNKNKFKKYLEIIFLLFIVLSISSCGNKFFKYSSAKDNPIRGEERARKNIQEGKGISLGGLTGQRDTTYEFSTSNPLWRASLEILDFMPLASVNYSGGILITDWYSDGNEDDSIKITIRFLNNQIASDSIKVIIHNRNCKNNKCSITELKSSIKEELTLKILAKAKILEQEMKTKK